MEETLDDINDLVRWRRFVAKLCNDTRTKVLAWERREAYRPDIVGPLYFTYVAGRAIGVLRYQYGETDEYGTAQRYSEDVAIEIVNDDGERIWRLPQVPQRFELIDLIEFREAGAEDVLRDYLRFDEPQG